MWKCIVITAFIVEFIFNVHVVDGCNEAICGSIVSKCLLTKSCKCDLKNNCTCCKECFSCLSDLYSECCSCVDMCPKPNETDTSLSKTSNVEDFPDHVAGLFSSLTEQPDPQDRWTSFIYPVDFDSTYFSPTKELQLHIQSGEQQTNPISQNITTLNCTVAFISKCMSWEKCKSHCRSMGSARCRWFHDSCCECIGGTCINYGLNESRCRKCSFQEEDNDYDNLLDEDIDLGEESNNHYVDQSD